MAQMSLEMLPRAHEKPVGSTLVCRDSRKSTMSLTNGQTGWGLANFLFTFPAYKRIDSLGRRSLLLTSLFGMIWSLLVVAFGFQIEPDNKSSSTRIGLVVTFFIIFVFFYSIGAGPVPFTFSAEVFPLAFRGMFKRLCRHAFRHF